MLLLKNMLYAGVGVGAAMLLRYLLPSSVSLTARFMIQGVVFVGLFLVMHVIFERRTAIPMFKKAFGKVKTMIKGAKNND